MLRIVATAVLCSVFLSTGVQGAEQGLTVKVVRYSSYASFTRIVFEVETVAPYVLTRSENKRSATLSAYNAPMVLKTPLPAIRDSVVSGLELHEDGGRTSITVRLEGAAGEVKDFVLRGPDRIVVDITKTSISTPVAAVDRPVMIVLDPGHGGRDTGIVTVRGHEKMLTLDLAIAVRKVLQRNPRFQVVMTRERDQTLTVDERATASNRSGAQLFVCIHSAPGEDVRVFIQDLYDESVLPMAQPAGDFLGFETGRELQEMKWGKQQDARLQESGSFGRKLARQFTGKENAEPVQAPLSLLRAVDAAAVLIEAGSGLDHMQLAESVAKGVEQYVREGR